MAELIRTTTLTDSCTRLDLYNLLAGAVVTNMTLSDVEGDLGMGAAITAASSPPSFTTSLWWYDQTNQLLKVPVSTIGASPASLYLAVGPDAWHYPGYNICSYTLPKGTLVRFSYEPDAGIYDCTPMEPLTTTVTGNRLLRCRPELRTAYGFIQDDTAPNGFGPVLSYGFGHCLVHWNTVASYVGSIWNTKAFELLPSSAVTGYMQATPPAANPCRYDAVCAMGLAQPEATNVSVLCPIFANLPMGKSQKEF